MFGMLGKKKQRKSSPNEYGNTQNVTSVTQAAGATQTAIILRCSAEDEDSAHVATLAISANVVQGDPTVKSTGTIQALIEFGTGNANDAVTIDIGQGQSTIIAIPASFVKVTALLRVPTGFVFAISASVAWGDGPGNKQPRVTSLFDTASPPNFIFPNVLIPNGGGVLGLAVPKYAKTLHVLQKGTPQVLTVTASIGGVGLHDFTLPATDQDNALPVDKLATGYTVTNNAGAGTNVSIFWDLEV